MSFTKIEPIHLTSVSASKTAITMCQNSGKTRQAERTRLIIRLGLLLDNGADLSWLMPGNMCEVAIGEGADEGRIMISFNTKQGDFLIGKTGGKADKAALLIVLPAMGPTKTEQKNTRCDYSVISDEDDRGCLIVMLPSWAHGKRPVAQPPAPQPEPNSAPGGGYRIGAPSHAEILKARGVRGS